MNKLKKGQIWSAKETITLNGVPVDKEVGIRVASIDWIRQHAHFELIKDPLYKGIVDMNHPDWEKEFVTWTLVEDVS